MNEKTYLSPPDITELEIESVIAAMKSGWVAPLGPEVDGFEKDFAAFCNVDFAVALSSGTAAIHLGLLSLGVGPGDKVVVPTLTFAATAFAVKYTGATPIFIDARMSDWNLDIDLLRDYLFEARSSGELPKVIIPVDIFGRTCSYIEINELAEEFGVKVLSDSAESLGAKYHGNPAGSLAEISAFSFNGNKIITTSGGGMITTNSSEIAKKIKYLSTQAREPVSWYEHREVGFNYRMSNILAAIGRSQLARLPEILAHRRAKHEVYLSGFNANERIKVVSNQIGHESNNWLTTVTIDSKAKPHAPELIIESLNEIGIESRRAWKPMHLQDIFKNNRAELNGTSDLIFKEGLCLPSGQNLTPEIQERVIETVLKVVK